MNELLIRVRNSCEVSVEETIDGIKSFKRITPDDLIKCVNSSMLRGGISSGLLPSGCLSFNQADNGDREVTLLFPDNKAHISYFGTVYNNFPLPRLVFGFKVNNDGRIISSRLGVVSNETVLRPDSVMYHYPFSNVSGINLCIGNNVMPKCSSLHTLSSLPYFILSMPNNNDRFSASNNKRSLEMRELLEHLKDETPEYYYSDILVLFDGAKLSDFITQY